MLPHIDLWSDLIWLFVYFNFVSFDLNYKEKIVLISKTSSVSQSEVTAVYLRESVLAA